MQVLVTGVAGFIGSHVTRRLLARGDTVVGIDNLNDYNPVQLKRDRLEAITADGGAERFTFHQLDFSDHEAIDAALGGTAIERIVHLGAQAGVRYSLSNPRAYVASNLAGHVNMLELARARRVEQMVYASSSSVYGTSPDLPFRVEQRVDFPISLYAATKKADELMSETYAHLYRIPQTGLRFFTVYGPWGRPDMAVWGFTDKILSGQPIEVYNGGNMRRDFTYIDDIVTGIVAALDHPPADDGQVKAGGSVSPHRLYNIGNNKAEELETLITLIEAACGQKAIRVDKGMQPGDVPATYADLTAIRDDLGFRPTTPIAVGIPKWVEWYKGYRARRG
ncbi:MULTISPECIES: NAD-dependent epimerase/dehydratase family protein [unclassified Sphingomonas]|uniref:NAD-dependent epimerase/dehydratase family protein n=1 Tax=unclassified Sphingomonas TaxID=196159 RepID=UPI001618DAE0|nr:MULTISPECIES: NAD-dependent epimerase/dehydratase family protein [unclassified Sphingomonas]MBB3347848.1 UDP-glucuronate 4-epimerase [Sphingomonas sp. BK069]MBB3474075.1 UDP-glucuronate 4-epimerase [Sphingomonas sp. BK345]